METKPRAFDKGSRDVKFVAQPINFPPPSAGAEELVFRERG